MTDRLGGINLDKLVAAIETERGRDGEGVQISNLGGWHSNTAMLEWGGEPAKALAAKAMALADAQTLDSRSPKDSRFTWHADM